MHCLPHVHLPSWLLWAHWGEMSLLPTTCPLGPTAPPSGMWWVSLSTKSMGEYWWYSPTILVGLAVVVVSLGGLSGGANGPEGVITCLLMLKLLSRRGEDMETQVRVVRMPSFYPRGSVIQAKKTHYQEMVVIQGREGCVKASFVQQRTAPRFNAYHTLLSTQLDAAEFLDSLINKVDEQIRVIKLLSPFSC